MMKLCFSHANTRMTEKYNGKDDLRDHLEKWTKAWRLLDDSQFPLLNETLLEETNFSSIWKTKDVDFHLHLNTKSKVFWV